VDSPASDLRSFLTAFRSEGLTFEEAWAESLRRLWIPTDQLDTWCRVIDDYEAYWRETYAGSEWEIGAICGRVLMDRSVARAEREHLSISQASSDQGGWS
jgi:hypothetical protein